MHKLLSLLLGVAVQSESPERRQAIINRIQAMPPEVQAKLVEEIQKVNVSAF